jgi:hypothetical protein
MNSPTAIPETMNATNAATVPPTSAGTARLPIAMLAAQTAVVRPRPPHEHHTAATAHTPGEPNLRHALRPNQITTLFCHGVAALPAATVHRIR